MKKLIIREDKNEITIELLEIDMWKHIVAFENKGSIFKLQLVPGGNFIFVNVSGTTCFKERIFSSHLEAIRTAWAEVSDIYVFDDFKSFLKWATKGIIF